MAIWRCVWQFLIFNDHFHFECAEKRILLHAENSLNLH